jgi:hypothetical protein
LSGEEEKLNKTKGKQRYIAYCGLYCEECPWYEGKIASFARDLRKELRNTRFDVLAKFVGKFPRFAVFRGYPKCYDVLGAMVKMRCSRICREGGIELSCKIRKCGQKRELEGCWECGEFEKCETLDFLKPGHGDAHLKNLRILKRKGIDSFIAGKKYWFSKI